MANLEPLMERNFLEYASYVVVDRAIPEMRDGLKPVQRRILHALHEMDDGKFHKVANVIGDTMKFHPHGDASIGEALVVLANKDCFLEKQGNFGNPLTGHKAAAARYIECRLTPLARETLFAPHLTRFVPSYDGRRREPECLPARLPVVLLLGTEGIAVGMATRILPHNLKELWEAQIRWLRGRRFTLLPDFPGGGRLDASEYADGRGRVRVRARLETRGDKRIVIREIPYSTTTEGLIASIEAAAQKRQLKIAAIHDFTTEHVEIEVVLQRGASAAEVIPQLYAYTDCEVSVAVNLLVIRDGRPAEMTVSEVLAELTAELQMLTRRDLEHERDRLTDRLHWLTLEQIFIENRVYQRIEKARSERQVRAEVVCGMEPFRMLLVRALAEEDVTRLLQIPIRRISLYDLQKNRSDLDEVARGIRKVEAKLADLTGTVIEYVKALLKRYGDAHPRRTEIATFDVVDKKAVANANLRVGHDPETGFFGTAVRGGPEALTVSEYDRILVVTEDGTYRIVSPPEKMLLPARPLHIALFDEDRGATLIGVYRAPDKRLYGKRFRIRSYIRGREYRLTGPRGGKLVFLTADPHPGVMHMSFVPAPRQRVKDGTYDLDKLPLCAPGARGTLLAPKPVRRLQIVKKKKNKT
ncbi:MAG: DNA topoisomerase IV subunit A [Planctomycetes bacterium]|nr:DNA topoisomerase IV subunit A [Planctomycetota bacterium]